mgnify:CR=1 FL=1
MHGIERAEIEELKQINLKEYLLQYDRASYRVRNNGTIVKKVFFVAPSVRKVPQLYSPKASYIATQLYLGYAQVIFASRVLGRI